jgi:hypothetical protein
MVLLDVIQWQIEKQVPRNLKQRPTPINLVVGAHVLAGGRVLRAPLRFPCPYARRRPLSRAHVIIHIQLGATNNSPALHAKQMRVGRADSSAAIRPRIQLGVGQGSIGTSTPTNKTGNPRVEPSFRARGWKFGRKRTPLMKLI